MSSLTGSSQDLFRLEKTLVRLEECSFYYAEMDKGKTATMSASYSSNIYINLCIN